MKQRLIGLFGCCFAFTAMGATDLAPIVSMGLYKNGHAFLTRRITPEQGVAYVEIPARLPAYGTFWHNAKTPVTVSTISNPQKVQVTFRADSQFGALIAEAEKQSGLSINIPALPTPSGLTPKPTSDTFFTVSGECLNYASLRRTALENNYSSHSLDFRIQLASGSLVTINKSVIVSSSGLTDVLTGELSSLRRWKFEGSNEPFDIQYLTEGATWAPAYSLVFREADQADLFMQADIRNEIAPWQDVDVSLISGFPAIKYASAKSLLADLTMSQFIQEITQAEMQSEFNNMRYGMTRPSITMNHVIPADEMDELSSAAYRASEKIAGVGADVYYRSIGKLSLGQNETVVLPIDAKSVTCQRIVDWEIGDPRNCWGQLNAQAKASQDSELWDSVKFSNPFDFPLTTGAIEMMEGNRLIGQGQCLWTNPGDETRVKITKALSIKGWCNEETVNQNAENSNASNEPEQIQRGKYVYSKETLIAKIHLQNFRTKKATINLKKRFSGELIECDLNPTKTRNLPARDGRLNSEHELAWEFDLNPNETKEIKVIYWLWVCQ